jgi:hypothetical protein
MRAVTQDNDLIFETLFKYHKVNTDVKHTFYSLIKCETIQYFSSVKMVLHAVSL